MCGRYTIIQTDQLAQRFDIKQPPKLALKPNYNVSPGQNLPIITRHGSNNQIELMHWGLIPAWAKSENVGYRMINAKAETLDQKPTWKRLFHRQRCIVPASGFYEWKKAGDHKTPYYIYLPGQSIFSLAGLYDSWQDDTGRALKSYAIITTAPNKAVAPIHDRMPAILEQSDEVSWLDQSIEEAGFLESLLRPYADDKIIAHPVSNQVNKPTNNSDTLIKEIET